MVSALVTASRRRIPSFAKFLLFTLSAVRYRARRPRCGNQRLESRVRENRQHGSEGGEAKVFPTPITTLKNLILNDAPHNRRDQSPRPPHPTSSREEAGRGLDAA